jgi:DNA topoisomerase II
MGGVVVERRTVDDFFNCEYRNYAIYTISARAIPSVIDGFKPAQRKIAFAANRLWKSGQEKPMKVFQLGGQAAAMSFFHHGSLDHTIIGMTQEFKNSLPIFQGIGQFGSLRSPEAGAPRYIGVKFNDNFRLLYQDFDLTTPQHEEGVEIEPRYFLPIIPTVLLNGGSGIAVGFATNILNREPVQLIDACLAILDGLEPDVLRPWIRGFTGDVVSREDTEGRGWAFHGRYHVKNTSTVEITEIPPSFTYEKYEAHLDSLVEKGVLHSYEDHSSDKIHYVLKVPRQTLAELKAKGKLDDTLKMRELTTENLTTLDEHGKLKVFETAQEVVSYFVAFRRKVYAVRKMRMQQDLASQITTLENKAKFVQAVATGTLSITNVKRADLEKQIASAGIAEQDGYGYLLDMPFHALTLERYDDLLSKLKAKREQLSELERTSADDLYRQDLLSLRKRLTNEPRKVQPPASPAGVPVEILPDGDDDVLSLFG